MMPNESYFVQSNAAHSAPVKAPGGGQEMLSTTEWKGFSTCFSYVLRPGSVEWENQDSSMKEIRDISRQKSSPTTHQRSSHLSKWVSALEKHVSSGTISVLVGRAVKGMTKLGFPSMQNVNSCLILSTADQLSAKTAWPQDERAAATAQSSLMHRHTVEYMKDSRIHILMEWFDSMCPLTTPRNDKPLEWQ